MNVRIDPSRYAVLSNEFNQPYFTEIKKFLVEEKKNNTEEKSFIFVKSEYKHVKIRLDDVFYFEGLKDYVKIWLHTHPKPILTLMSLKTLEQELMPNKFMRVHRSFIIALDKIDVVERGRVKINNTFITIAEQYKSKFHEFIDGKLIS